MSFAKGRLALPKKVETVQVYNVNGSVESLDGKFPAWAGGGCEIAADFNANPGPSPHSAIGSIKVLDGAGAVVLDVSNAVIQIEEGPKDGVWHTVASFAASGNDLLGRAFAFRNGEQNPLDETSVIVDFALADTAALADSQAVKVWSGEVQPVSDTPPLPLWVMAWLQSYGVSVVAFTEYIKGIAGKVDAPETLTNGIVEWIKANLAGALDPTRILAFAMLVVAELKGGHPGYNSDAGGVA